MGLYNVTTVNNTLLATEYVANATSEVVNQDAGDTDFESVRESRVHWRLQNISDGSLSSADTLVSTAPLQNGDRMFLRLNSGAIYDILASNVTVGTTPVHPNMTSNTQPEGVAKSNTDSTDDYLIFDGDDNTKRGSSLYTDHWAYYQFKDNVPQTIYSYYIKATSSYTGTTQEFNFKIEGSLDGVNWATISTENSSHNEINSSGHIYQIESPGSFSYYRIYFTDIYSYAYLNSFSLLSGSGSIMDTSAYTNGEIPDQVFKFTDTLAYNGNIAVEKDVFYEYGTSGTKLAVTSLYNDVLVGGRTLTTHLEFTTSGNEIVEITGQVYKAV